MCVPVLALRVVISGLVTSGEKIVNAPYTIKNIRTNADTRLSCGFNNTPQTHGTVRTARRNFVGNGHSYLNQNSPPVL